MTETVTLGTVITLVSPVSPKGQGLQVRSYDIMPHAQFMLAR